MAGAVMLDHVSITVSDLPRAARFYDAVMAALRVPCVNRSKTTRSATACATAPTMTGIPT